LVIDDEEGIRLVAQGMLNHCGYDVILAYDGMEGLEKFQENIDKIHLVLLDMSMPKMSGKETFYHLKEIKPSIKIIMTSGFKHDNRVMEVLNAGADDFLRKPFTLEQLSHTVYNVLKT